MKTMTSREAQNSFGSFLDTAQREPVMVTRHNRPAGVMLSMDNLPAIFDLVDSMREQIKAGVTTGLEQANAGMGRELTSDYVTEMQDKLKARLAANAAAWKVTA